MSNTNYNISFEYEGNEFFLELCEKSSINHTDSIPYKKINRNGIDKYYFFAVTAIYNYNGIIKIPDAYNDIPIVNLFLNNVDSNFDNMVKEIHISRYISYVNVEEFERDNSVKVYVDELNPFYITDINHEYLIYKPYKELTMYTGGETEKLVCDEEIKHIGSFAFSYSKFKKLEFNNTSHIVRIEEDAFDNSVIAKKNKVLIIDNIMLVLRNSINIRYTKELTIPYNIETVVIPADLSIYCKRLILECKYVPKFINSLITNNKGWLHKVKELVINHEEALTHCVEESVLSLLSELTDLTEITVCENSLRYKVKNNILYGFDKALYMANDKESQVLKLDSDTYAFSHIFKLPDNIKEVYMYNKADTTIIDKCTSRDLKVHILGDNDKEIVCFNTIGMSSLLSYVAKNSEYYFEYDRYALSYYYSFKKMVADSDFINSYLFVYELFDKVEYLFNSKRGIGTLTDYMLYLSHNEDSYVPNADDIKILFIKYICKLVEMNNIKELERVFEYGFEKIFNKYIEFNEDEITTLIELVAPYELIEVNIRLLSIL